MALSVYLLYGHYAGIHWHICELGTHISCNKLNQQGYSTFYGVPVAFMGVEWFAVLLLVCWSALPEQQPVLHAGLVLWAGLGLLSVVCFVIVEIIVGAICPFCTAVHIVVVLTLVLSIRLLRLTQPRPELSLVWEQMRGYPQVLGSFVMLNAFVMGLFNLQWDSVPDLQWDGQAQVDLLDCLREKKVTMWAAAWCGHCMAQKNMFGDRAANLTMVDCTAPANQATCTAMNITRYPTWIYGDKRRLGRLTFPELASFAECQISHKPPGARPKDLG
uniref:Vitamin K epoxide reductase domain-containing protein n=1 Tax=Eutreptiella gymnastica TaxID=73025 RepID=A0A7S4GPX9_9EUGL